MKLSKTGMLLVALCMYGHVYGQKTDAKAILQKSAEILKSKQLFQYQASYQIKFFDNADTTKFGTFQCTVLKAPQDTVLGYHARLHTSTEERIYDGYAFMLISHNQKRILRDNPSVSGKKFTLNNIKREFIPSFCYSATPFQTYLNDAKEMKLSALNWGKTKVWKIEIWLPTDTEITLLKRVVYIDQQSYLPQKVEGFAKYQDIQDEYFELNLSNLSAAVSTETDFSTHYQYPQNYTEEIFKAPTVNYDPLPLGAAFIPVEGLDLQAKPLKIAAEATQNKLILLDFWYLACGNCLLAMPHLSTLAEKYQTQGLAVYGLNPYDDPLKKATIAQKFLDKFKVTYPQVFVDKTLTAQYQIKIYPSMYLIKNGQVVYTHLGYSEASMQELEAAIVANLPK